MAIKVERLQKFQSRNAGVISYVIRIFNLKFVFFFPFDVCTKRKIKELMRRTK